MSGNKGQTTAEIVNAVGGGGHLPCPSLLWAMLRWFPYMAQESQHPDTHHFIDPKLEFGEG